MRRGIHGMNVHDIMGMWQVREVRRAFWEGMQIMHMESICHYLRWTKPCTQQGSINFPLGNILRFGLLLGITSLAWRKSCSRLWKSRPYYISQAFAHSSVVLHKMPASRKLLGAQVKWALVSYGCWEVVIIWMRTVCVACIVYRGQSLEQYIAY